MDNSISPHNYSLWAFMADSEKWAADLPNHVSLSKYSIWTLLSAVHGVDENTLALLLRAVALKREHTGASKFIFWSFAVSLSDYNPYPFRGIATPNTDYFQAWLEQKNSGVSINVPSWEGPLLADYADEFLQLSNQLRSLSKEADQVPAFLLVGKESYSMADFLNNFLFFGHDENLISLAKQVKKNAIHNYRETPVDIFLQALERIGRVTQKPEGSKVKDSDDISMIASAIPKIRFTIDEIARNTRKAEEVTTVAVYSSLQSSEIATKLGKFATEIDQVSEVVSEISGQINLLALNANIEAGRAGEAGKGFVVVANEINDLTEQMATATLDIKKMSQGVQEAIGAAANEINDTRAVIKDVADIVSTIEAAIEECSTVVEEIAWDISLISKNTTEKNALGKYSIDQPEEEEIVADLPPTTEEQIAEATVEKRQKVEPLEEILELEKMFATDAVYLEDLAASTEKQGRRATRKPKYEFWNESGERVTWTGQGRMPNILKAKIEAGESLESFLIDQKNT